MVKQLLVCAGVAMSFTAFGYTNQSAPKTASVENAQAMQITVNESFFKEAKKNDGSRVRAKAASASTNVHWKRPAGQFWGSGWSPEMGSWYYYTPLSLRPWVNYTFENISTLSGNPSWTLKVLVDPQTGEYQTETSTDQNVSQSYLRYEACDVPIISYKNLSFPLLYDGEERATNQSYPNGFPIVSFAGESIYDVFGANMCVSSHFFSVFSRNPVEGQGIGGFTGAKPYDDMETGYWFGTNNQGFNAMATRFEKPDQPYLLNGVYFMYAPTAAITKEVPLKAYVFKTESDAATYEFTDGSTAEGCALGELIATAEAFVPMSSKDDVNHFMTVDFRFVEKNPVTGAENSVSLEIDDDITVVVTGFNAEIGGNAGITSFVSFDEFDEGYGNLGFLGSLTEAEDGTIDYSLLAIKDFFVDPLPNSTLGVLADVSYPWLVPLMREEQPSSVKFANEGDTTETFQGLQYQLNLLSTSETSDYEITYNDEEECEWLSVIDVLDEYETNADGEEEFSGYTALLFEAAPNPNDETRKCNVKISIPAATYTIEFLQGSKAESGVKVVKVEGEAQYFDLAGRRVANPSKGIYVKVSGNKAEKVIL